MAPVTAEREGRERKIPSGPDFSSFSLIFCPDFSFSLSHILSRFLLLSLSYSVQISPSLSLIFCPDFSFSLSHILSRFLLSLSHILSGFLSLLCLSFFPSYSVSHFFPLPLPLTFFHNFSFPPLFSPFPPTFLPLSRPVSSLFPFPSDFSSYIPLPFVSVPIFLPFHALSLSPPPPFPLSYLVLPPSTSAPSCSIRGQTQNGDNPGLSADTPALSENKKKVRLPFSSVLVPLPCRPRGRERTVKGYWNSRRQEE